MTPLPEAFREGHAFTLVYEGLGEETRRNMHMTHGWRGLSANDRTLLAAHVSAKNTNIQALHTDVPVGVVPADHATWATDWHRQRWLQIHPLRIDAVTHDNTGWTILECKPDAGYVALGQLLTYSFWAAKCIKALRGCRVGVITDRCQASILPVYKRHNVHVFEYPDCHLDG